MSLYLVSIHRPHGYDPLVAEDDAMTRSIDALNEEMQSAGVRVFAGGLRPISTARSLRPQPDGGVVVSDGPYLQTTEHVGGFWLLDVSGSQDALAWGRKAALVCRANVEVRPFH